MATRRDRQLADLLPQASLGGVEGERLALIVARGLAEEQRPALGKPVVQGPKPGEVITDLLQRDQVEPRDDPGDQIEMNWLAVLDLEVRQIPRGEEKVCALLGRNPARLTVLAQSLKLKIAVDVEGEALRLREFGHSSKLQELRVTRDVVSRATA